MGTTKGITFDLRIVSKTPEVKSSNGDRNRKNGLYRGSREATFPLTEDPKKRESREAIQDRQSAWTLGPVAVL